MIRQLKASVSEKLFKLAGYTRDTKTGQWSAGVASGVGALALGAKSLLAVLGISAVTHSSGAAIITAGSGYVAGTMGIGASIIAIFSWFFVVPLFLICSGIGLFVLLTKSKETDT
ncbi:hypothetical protein DI396_11930 [Litorivita pollutaquae]|uniref:Uncharacterized protein n=1 Tax=Litorivita pollutaquae TaxID=2200892 RepID=A0A2V4MNX8_9RHOB|nr:hypothetical protein DI396_11930 [Litorivita pollutaquae]